MDESRQWVEFGKWLAEQREERGLRRREAAKRAKISETTWRDLETGRKPVVGGIRLLPNPSKDVLERVAGVLELPVEDVLARVGTQNRSQPVPPSSVNGKATGEAAGTIELKMRRLSERDRGIVEQLVDAMLQHSEG